jgi:hypothetical protein
MGRVIRLITKATEILDVSKLHENIINQTANMME